MVQEHIRGTYRVFFSLHYKADVSRADRIREMRAPNADNESWNAKGFWVMGFGFAKVRKVQSGRIGPEAWELQRWLVGRIDPDKRGPTGKRSSAYEYIMSQLGSAIKVRRERIPSTGSP